MNLEQKYERNMVIKVLIIYVLTISVGAYFKSIAFLSYCYGFSVFYGVYISLGSPYALIAGLISKKLTGGGFWKWFSYSSLKSLYGQDAINEALCIKPINMNVIIGVDEINFITRNESQQSKNTQQKGVGTEGKSTIFDSQIISAVEDIESKMEKIIARKIIIEYFSKINYKDINKLGTMLNDIIKLGVIPSLLFSFYCGIAVFTISTPVMLFDPINGVFECIIGAVFASILASSFTQILAHFTTHKKILNHIKEYEDERINIELNEVSEYCRSFNENFSYKIKEIISDVGVIEYSDLIKNLKISEFINKRVLAYLLARIEGIDVIEIKNPSDNQIDYLIKSKLDIKNGSIRTEYLEEI